MIISKSELIKEQKSSIALSDGVYNSQLVGYMVSKRQPYNKPDAEPYDAIRFSFALVDDNDNQKIVTTPDYRLSFSERSNLYKQLASLAKSTNPEDLWTRMEAAGFIDGDNFNLDKFLGIHVSLMTTMQASPKDPSKLFPSFTFTPSKKNNTYDAVESEDGKKIPIWIPSFIEDEDIVEMKCIDICEWKRYEEAEVREFDAEKGTIKKSVRKTPEWSEAQKSEHAEEAQDETPEVHSEDEDKKPAPRLKPRQKKSDDIPF